MYTILCDATGKRREGVLLAASANQMRLAVRGLGDAVELAWQQGKWVGEDGEPVEVESVLAGPRPEWAYFACGVPTRHYVPERYLLAG
ncbi:MAG: hypothetical protein LAP40_22105 [Acidobacteriia bacterium]|nr:hypothetical protein [Terriglobia bacterium]